MTDTDVTAKGTRQANPVDRGGPHFIHKELDTGIESRFSELDLPHIVLGDHNVRLIRRLSVMQNVGPCTTLLPDAGTLLG